jgi:putative transposase
VINMCLLAGFSRSGYYRSFNSVAVASQDDLKLRDAMHRIALVGSLNQLWIADITYIRLDEEFVYLAVILDAYSRRAAGLLTLDEMAQVLGITPTRVKIWRRHGLIHGHPYDAGNACLSCACVVQ